MRILCVCDEGNSRSPTIASLLRYRSHDTLSVGVRTAGPETLAMLVEWCELAILTDAAQEASFPQRYADRLTVWPIDDTYPRPFNRDLRDVVQRFIFEEGL